MIKMNMRLFYGALTALFACSQTTVEAEDIDLFVGSQSAIDRPNILFIVDNTANWTAAFADEMAALRATFENFPVGANGTAKFNVGLMLAAETGSTDSNISGGYVRAAIRPMTAANKALYVAMIAALDVGADKGNGGASSLLMAEAYRYFAGGDAYAGRNKAKADFAGNTTSDFPNTATRASIAAMKAIYSLPGNALTSKGANAYTPPSAGGSDCGHNYIIYISNGPSQDSNSVLAAASSMLSALGGTVTQIALSPSGSQTNVSDEWARFMRTSVMGVTTYTIDVDARTTGQGPGWSTLLRSMAVTSGGEYVSASSANGGAAIREAIERALSEIQAVNSVFASVSLPVSANTQGNYANQIYIGMFRPDSGAMPRWYGNLKQYQFGRQNGALRLLDADSRDAINALNGSVTECARSYWTPSVPDAYWSFSPSGDCIPPAGSAADLYQNSNFPDGSQVQKGAQAGLLRAGSVASRVLKTCAASDCTALGNFATTNSSITATALGVSSAERDALINWARGRDFDDENNNVNSTEIRPSAHGDVAHSRPVAIDLGTAIAPKVVVFYGGNDGVFRAVNGNRSAAIGTVPAGAEMWGFMPPEFYGQLQRLRANTLRVTFPYMVGSSAPKPYGMDGPISVHQGSSETWVYATMRRGGRMLYAFRVNNSNPTDIALKWRKGCPEMNTDAGCSTGFAGIGQTWSSALPFKAAGYSAGGQPLLIMGGGYDKCEDSDPAICTSSSKGNKIYVLDANDGTLLKTFDTDRGVIADVVPVADSATALATVAYTTDLGGNVYRINIGTAAPADWTLTKVASLGCTTATTCSPNRKFIFAPDIVRDGADYTLLIGSGDREKPILYYSSAASVKNYFFMLRDRPADTTWLTAEADACGAPVLCLASLLPITTPENPSPEDLAGKKGWYLGMRSTEQVVTSAITIFGTVTFSTHTPDVAMPGSCSARLGTARAYNIDYTSAAPADPRRDRSAELPTGTGLPPSPVAGLVQLDDGEVAAFCVGCSAESAIQAQEPEVPLTSIPAQPIGRVYWLIER